ncbi:MAG: hypothetical protein GY807_13215, partial [Gammaproteobacteria bacterium]|nr:hypothetical protein [Gammaproteobacteria bacterium]
MNSRYPHYPTICTLLSLLFLQGCGGGSGGTDGSGVIQDPPTFTHSKLDTAGKQPLFVQIASNSNGDAIIAWQYFERNIDTSVWSNRFTPGLGWSAAKNVFDSALVGDLRVSMDGNGDAAFMTTRSDERTASGIPDVFANTEISGVVGNQQQLALASVRGKITAGLPGKSVAVGGWEHVEAKGLGRDTFETAEYRLGAGWTRPIPIPILTSTEQDSSFHQINHSAVVALEPGRRLAVVNTNKKLRYNVGSSEGDWNAAANVITSSGIDPLSVHFLAAGGNGRAVLVWVDFLSGGADYRVLSTWFNGVSWGPIESIATQTGIIVFEDSFQVAADAQGNAVVV